MECSECGCSVFREFEGDTTCTCCGLVLMSNTIDDTMKSLKDVEYRDLLIDSTVVVDTCLKKKFYTILSTLSFVDNHFINIALAWFDLIQFDTRNSNFKLYAAATTMCVGLYTRRGIDPELICHIFGIKFGDLDYTIEEKLLKHHWAKTYWAKEIAAKISLDEYKKDRLKRSIYTCCCIASENTFKIVTLSFKIYDKVKNFPQISSSKSNTLFCTLVWISVRIARENISLPEICNHFNVSPWSVKATETVVQGILSKT